MAHPVSAIYILATSMSLVLSSGAGCREEATRPRVHVAASLAAPVEDVLEGRADVSVGSSFAIARQLVAGMPADVVVLADPKAMDGLVDRLGLDVADRTVLAWNRLAIVVPAGPPAAPGRPSDPATGRIAVGDPDATPLGRYTRQSLEASGRWAAMRDRLVVGGDARAVVSLVERGEVDLGVVYESDAIVNPRIKILERLDPTTHDAIRCDLAVVGEHPDASSIRDRIRTGIDWSEVGFLGGDPRP